MIQAEGETEVLLVARMGRGDKNALETFISRHGRLIYQICHSVAPNEAAAIAAYKDLLGSPGFAKLFSDFEGGSTFRTFAAEVVISGFLFPRLLRLISVDPRARYSEFSAFFRSGFDRAVASKIQDQELRRDALQWIHEKLVENDYAQLRSWAKDAQKQGYIYSKVHFLVQDFLNSRDAPSQTRKRTIPAAILRLSDFDKHVFQQMYWYNVRSTPSILLSVRKLSPEADEKKVIDARIRVDEALGSKGIATVIRGSEIDIDDVALPAPEGPKVDDSGFEAFARRLREISSTWPPNDNLYLLKFSEGKSSQTIADEMGLPITEIYKIAKKVMDKLRKSLRSDPVAKNLIASVTGNEAYLEGDTSGTKKP